MTDRERYRTDPIYAATWHLAHRHMEHLWDVRLEMDEPEVLGLRDMLVSAFEAGAQRTMDQTRQIDEALTDHRLHTLRTNPIVVLTDEQAAELAGEDLARGNDIRTHHRDRQHVTLEEVQDVLRKLTPGKLWSRDGP